MMKACLLVPALLLGACASSGASWSASTWDGLVPQTIATQNYAFMAAPMAGQGFKLKLSIKTDGSFGVASAGPPTDEQLTEAAIVAAPDGCTFVSLERTPDGGAEAHYDCG
ncbi:MAG: hypothetical protein KJ871_16910 [Alphaproteobacteria bacterium]|nr:hypothetical protein [Alphaproteobacteria bacterium]MBU2082670.1 hypothetical protein [Alphaproteobacteria bacterium]MBU2142233.1 hypothetical protein [Alphaproteobacteria bacterium]MBU2196724.1 hypothetical protein [Alphaproteobacteria bacterium]